MVSDIRETLYLTDAALRLRMRYQRALNKVYAGELEGWKDKQDRWVVSRSSVERLLANRERQAVPAA